MEDEPHFLVDVKRMQANKAGLEALGLTIDLLVFVWHPARDPFRYEDACKKIANGLPARGYTQEKFDALRTSAQTFFTVMEDGRWVPSPDYFGDGGGYSGH